MTAESSGRFGGQSMTGRLRRVLVASPDRCGWTGDARQAAWRDLGYLRPVDGPAAVAQHGILVAELEAAGVEVDWLEADESVSMDAVYTHDPSLLTDGGAIVLSMGKRARAPEAKAHTMAYERLGIPILGRIKPPGTIEAGDVVWLDEATLLAGRSYRTNSAGIDQLRRLVRDFGVEVLEAAIPHGDGPEVCLHLMSLLSLLDETTILVDLPLLAVETVEMLRARGFRLVEIDPGERENQGANVLSLGDRRLIALEENANTNDRLRQAGFAVATFLGSEIAQNGGGGPTCLTRPLWRG